MGDFGSMQQSRRGMSKLFGHIPAFGLHYGLLQLSVDY